jgi:hypothetical protein
MLNDITGKSILKTEIKQGSTIALIDLQKIYEGTYIITLTNGKSVLNRTVSVRKD